MGIGESSTPYEDDLLTRHRKGFGPTLACEYLEKKHSLTGKSSRRSEVDEGGRAVGAVFQTAVKTKRGEHRWTEINPNCRRNWALSGCDT